MSQGQPAGEPRSGYPMPAAGGSSRLALTAAAGIGVFAGLAGAAVAALLNQAKATVSAIQQAAINAAITDGLLPPGESDHSLVAELGVPRADGVYLPDGSYLPDRDSLPDRTYPSDGSRQSEVEGPDGPPQPEVEGPDGSVARSPLVLAMLGDSTSVGYGTRSAADVPGVRLAAAVAAELERPVRLRTHGRSGCGAADLPRQLAEALPGGPDIAVIVVGANDIRNKVPPSRSAGHLGEAVAALRAQGIPVVVGTCPDFGVIDPIPQPLRTVLQTWSRLLATLQERAVLAAGGRSVPIGRLVSPGFAHHPELFAGDHFHPSGAGYARAVEALLPVTIQELRQASGAGSTIDIVA